QATLVREEPEWIAKKLMDFMSSTRFRKGEDTLIPSLPSCRISNDLRNRKRNESFWPCKGPLSARGLLSSFLREHLPTGPRCCGKRCERLLPIPNSTRSLKKWSARSPRHCRRRNSKRQFVTYLGSAKWSNCSTSSPARMPCRCRRLG